MICPCFDYASVVYGPMLTQSQSEQLKRQQRKIIKTIVGREESYERALKFTGLERLDVRRNELINRFALRLSVNDRFKDGFPLNTVTNYGLRTTKKYQELPFRTERLRKAPIYQYRRDLNALHEKENVK